MLLTSVNPTTGEILATYPEMSPVEVDQALCGAERAFLAWREVPVGERAAALVKVAARLRERREELARLMALEMGKPLAAGRAEVDKCAWVCDFYAEKAAEFLAPQEIATEATRSFVAFPPLGVVLAVMPWNYPLWQVFRFAAPALAAGDGAVLKHASNVTGCALAIGEIFAGTGLPEGLFTVLRLGGSRVAEAIAHPAVAAVTLTGSTPAGRAVAATAGSHLKKTVLELGGSDPYLILSDADLDAAVPACVASRLINAGQSCIAAKRFLVPREIAGEVERRFVERLAAAVVGDPLDEATEVGPLSRRDLAEEVHRQVEASVEAGARLLLGGELPPGPAAFYPPSALGEVRPGMPAADEELFGPVAAILPVGSEEEAVAVANASPFGLGAAVFTRDLARGETLALRLEAGCCFVNAFVRSDPRMPFGGVKESGFGRELGLWGIREFVNVKTIWVA